MGYPSWRRLADAVRDLLGNQGRLTHPDAYERFLGREEFPELFRQAERDAGGREQLIQILSPLLQAMPGRRGIIYELLTAWPFACYLTTNFDDEISAHLKAIGFYFRTILNKPGDLRLIREDVSNLIVKLHGDLTDPDTAIITSRDYERFTTHDAGNYFRSKLRSIIETFDVLIVGSSFTDWNIRLVVEAAKQTSNPEHPIFFITSDINEVEQREYRERYNIVVIPYENPDGRHARLRRLLTVADKFIVPRARRDDQHRAPIDPTESESALSLLIYRRLHSAQKHGAALPGQYLGPVVLQSLALAPNQQDSIEGMLARQPLKPIATQSPAMRDAIDQALATLASDGLVTHTEAGWTLTDQGRVVSDDAKETRQLLEGQAYGQFLLNLRREFPSLMVSDEEDARARLESAIVGAFKSRGLAIASAVFANQSVLPDDLTDLFRSVSNAAGELAHEELRNAFVIAARDFLLEPTSPQRKYLAAVSQGYFLYHLAGLDPLGTRVRRELFRQTGWLCDSSIILPALAIGSNNHPYATDLFRRLTVLGAPVHTTSHLIQEVWEHLSWAIRMVSTYDTLSPDFMDVALLHGRYKQNLFLDGFIRLSAAGDIGTFNDYLEKVVPGGTARENILRGVADLGVTVVDLTQFDGFRAVDFADTVEIQSEVQADRESHGIFRGEQQVEAEAEVLQMIRGMRRGILRLPNHPDIQATYFVSQSRVLNRVAAGEPFVTWTPEPLYRYLNALPGEEPDPDLLQECMLHQYYDAGVEFIDTQKYSRFFGGAINTSRLHFAEQKQRYVDEFGSGQQESEFEERFERTPDLEKPFFVSQMGWRLASESAARATREARRASEAETQLKHLKADIDLAKTIRERRRRASEAGRQRNAKDANQLRKRKRQAKRRVRKKRKH